MRSISALLIALAFAPAARAQVPADGFALERLYLSAPGAGWFVLDDLRQHGGLGAAAGVTLGYARRPLSLTGGAGRLDVVSDQLMAELGLALTYDRFRLSLGFAGPIVFSGESGQRGGYQYAAPPTDLQQNPDTIADPRIGLDARLYGEEDSALRVGASAQLIIPAGVVADYITDGTYRGMVRLLLAGDRGRFTWAGQLGVHLRPRDDGPGPGGPRGSELLFGVAGGARLATGAGELLLGPEVFGETAFKGAQATGVEALLGARLEGGRADGARVRFRLGLGAGLDPRFGAPAFRVVAGVELSGHAQER